MTAEELYLTVDDHDSNIVVITLLQCTIILAQHCPRTTASIVLDRFSPEEVPPVIDDGIADGSDRCDLWTVFGHC